MPRIPGVCAIGVLVCAAIATSRPHAIALPDLPLPVFEDVAKKAGIDFELESGSEDRQFILESNSAGVILIDYDNDGWLDVYFVNGSTPDRADRHEKSAGNRLYHNNHDGTFTDVTDKAGVRGNGAWGEGGCAGDVDNNGFDDIFITNYGPDVLLLNNGDGTFRDVSKEAGIEGPADRWHSGCAFGDYDRDGDLDLYVSTYVDFTLEFGRKDPRYVNPRAPANYKIYNPGPGAYKSVPDEFYENAGGGRFADVSEKSGILNTKPGNGFGVVWGDYNNDGYPDIYVANDLTPNHLFRNNRDKTFTDVGVAAGAALDTNGKPQASMGVDMADYDNDGHLDVIVTNFAEDHTTLYRNDGSGGFIDVSKEAGFPALPFLGWGIQFVDLDLDGFQDLIAVNGHVHPRIAGPRLDLAQAGYRQRWLGYRNRGNGTFDEVGRTLGEPFTRVYGSRGLAVGDLNNDGQMDLVVTNQEAPQSVLMNKGVPGNWALFKLRGTTSNRSAIGARVTLRAGGVTQIREVKSGGSYLSQSDLRLHFGLGAATKIDEVSIRWPSGAVQVERDVAANRIVTLTEK